MQSAGSASQSDRSTLDDSGRGPIVPREVREVGSKGGGTAVESGAETTNPLEVASSLTKEAGGPEDGSAQPVETAQVDFAFKGGGVEVSAESQRFSIGERPSLTPIPGPRHR
jgi:hypothetical protein